MSNLERKIIRTTNTNQTVKDISISQFNVLAHGLCENGGFDTDPTILTWPYRKTLFKNILLENTFDIMCFEEVDDMPLEEIRSILQPIGYDYAWSAKFRSQYDEPNDGTAIFWNSKLFTMIDRQFLRYEYDSKPATQFALILQLKDNDDQIFCVVATHLKAKPGFEQVRKSQVEQLMSELNKLNLPTIICGDFNDTPNSLACCYMKENYQSVYESEFIEPIKEIWTTCKKRKELVKRTIDYIFCSNHFECLGVLSIPQDPMVFPNAEYPSDHLMIGAILVRK